MSKAGLVRKLQLEKTFLKKRLLEIDIAYQAGLLNKAQYEAERKALLKGRSEEEVFEELERRILEAKNEKPLLKAVAVITLLALLLPLLKFSGITSLVVFNPTQEATLTLNENYTGNATKDLSFIKADSLKVTGKIYGQGEARIYLVTSNGKKLVYYADTRSQALTGMVVYNQTNATTQNASANATTSNTSSAENATTNATTNASINTANATAAENATTNATINTTTNATNASTNLTIQNASANATVNATNATTQNATANNQTNAATNLSTTATPSVATDKQVYLLGETVSITVTPNSSSYSLYVHAPSNTYYLEQPVWKTLETGTHTVTALVTINNKTERVSTIFQVISNSAPSVTFTKACVETCYLQSEPVVLSIELHGVMLELDNITYKPSNASINNTANASNATSQSANATLNASGNATGSNTANNNQTSNASNQASNALQNTAPSPRDLLRKCLAKNPNLRPRYCFTPDKEKELFPEKNFTLVNSLGMRMAVLDSKGNLYLKGNLYQQATGASKEFDFVVKGVGQEAAWIDVLTGDLYLRGTVYENQETLMWDSRQDYVISNEKGMYLAIFDAETGNLYLRGSVKEVSLR